MSDYVTDEMVETAARTEWDVVWGDVIDWDEADPKSREMFSRGIRPALEAVAPQIAATALRDAADAWQWGGWSTITEPAKRPEQVPRVLGIADAVTGWIRARADQSEKEDT